MNRQIIALGGAGFSSDPDNPRMDNYILSQSNKENPKICFIPTASGDAEIYIQSFYSAYEKKNCVASHLSLFKGHTEHIEEFIFEQDILYVGGGNTKNMLALWREWGLDEIIKKAYQNETILSGISAGSICWFEQGLTDSIPNRLSKLDCLGILEGSNCPHFDGEPERQEVYKQMIQTGEMKAGIACDDGVALHFINENLEKIISSQPNKNAYKFEMKWMLKETVFEPTYLD